MAARFGEEGSPTLPFARPLGRMGDQGQGRVMGGGWGPVNGPDSSVRRCAFVQPLCRCLCLGPACVWEDGSRCL